MSTRSIIAYRDKDTGDALFTNGAYVHWDGYPTHMGKSWWTILHHDLYRDNLAAFAEYFIIANACGWSIIDDRRDFLAKPISPEENQNINRRFSEFSTPEAYDAHQHTLPLVSFRARRWDLMAEYGHKTEAEADPRCTSSNYWETMELFTPDDLAECWCEWLYIVDIDARTFAVYKLVYGDKGNPKPCGIFSLDAAEPDWEIVENRGN